jgi:hypothetical protein
MLFQRLYNWIKYKTLPSSFLFKNRLFIERDSKHRRVFSNFGLSFRNSKWSNYETSNIKLQFKKAYLKFIFWLFFIFFFLLFIFYFNQYYIIFYFFNNITFFFWISIDTFDYYLSFLTWIVTLSFSLLFNLIYSYFFFNNFSNNLKIKNEFFNNSNFLKLSLNSSFDSKNLYVSKHDLNWFLYSWLTNPFSTKNDFILENLFKTSLNKNWWNLYYDFFIKLYKLSYLLKNTSHESSLFWLNNRLNSLSNNYYKGNYTNTLNYFINNSSLNNYSSLILYYILNNYTNYFSKINNKNSSLSFLKNKYEWNLYNFNNELENYTFLLQNRNGMFFLNNFNYEKFSYFIFNFEELWSLNFFFKNQLNSAKWNRWLYRYSILHRKLLKFSHKLTLSKRLINSGFYDSKIFNKNIWATEHLNKINLNSEFSSFYLNYYSTIFNAEKNFNIFNNLSINNNGSSKDSLNFLNFYENSYFWYLKRFYLLNSLSTNFIKSKNILNLNKLNYTKVNELKNSNFLKYSIFLNYLLNSNFINLNSYSHFNNSYINILEKSFLHNSEYSFFKDIYLLSNDNDFLNKDNLNLFYWITSNINKQNNLVFFNYLNFNNLSNNLSYNFDFTPSSFKDVNNLNFWLIYSLINIDSIYLNDVTYLSFFN